jgi:hypothetical protein
LRRAFSSFSIRNFSAEAMCSMGRVENLELGIEYQGRTGNRMWQIQSTSYLRDIPL